ncbi:Muscle M-line assembly unc-89 [Brachionus plicatilis]|uniref:Muscle M-line assembly unc-89 n=1 Tax=Brachionus plicatilis TaxID=10195 RepID=A0A3M7PB66_BRAPC|nr:Muscle M-line assembly unc-89 [Brachionus plicatilis]
MLNYKQICLIHLQNTLQFYNAIKKYSIKLCTYFAEFLQTFIFGLSQLFLSIKWFKNDEEIGETSEIRVQQDDNKYCLTIDDCKPEDSGEYKAILINSFGQTQSQCRLNVLSNEIENKPVFVEVLKDISVSEGHDVCLKCKVTGFPQPVIRWFRNATELEESSRVKVRI